MEKDICPYFYPLGSGYCDIVTRYEDEGAGTYKICKSSEWADCPHYLELCREAEKAAANVYAEQAAKRFLELIK